MNVIEKAVSHFIIEPVTDSEAHDATFDRITLEPKLAEYFSSPCSVSQHATVDFDKLKHLGILTPDEPVSRIAVELRHIKHRLLGESLEPMVIPYSTQCHNLIMLTSSRLAEGKTFLAINLAISIAMEADRKVVLVDTDASSSDVSKILGIKANVGLTDLLFSPTLTLVDALIRTNIGGLHIVPAGTKIPNAPELLSSPRMSNLLRTMAHQFSEWLFIFDSPPLLAATEPSRLARDMGQVVVVVHEGKTTQKELMIALKQIEFARNIGLVLNKSFDRSDTAYFEHYRESQVF